MANERALTLGCELRLNPPINVIASNSANNDVGNLIVTKSLT